ncbi:hypothetical protein [Halosegnis longus]|nr:hypothetical protein [Halosegnis longus]
MSAGSIFDTEAIIAFLYNDPGHEVVAELLRKKMLTGDTEGVLTA